MSLLVLLMLICCSWPAMANVGSGFSAIHGPFARMSHQRAPVVVPRRPKAASAHDWWGPGRKDRPRKKRFGKRCRGCAVWLVPVYQEPHSHRADRIVETDSVPRIEERTRVFGPIIRRDSCVPKVYVRDPDTGRFDTYCGGTELLNSAEASADN